MSSTDPAERRPAPDDVRATHDLGDAFAGVLERAQAGDRDAFGLLWRSAHPGLLRYLFVLCGGDSAEDVASETWVKVLRSLASFTGDERAFRGWLATVARHAAIDRGRRLGRLQERPDGLSPREPLTATPESADPAELAVDAAATRAALRLVATLPPAVAEMVVLRVIMGLDVAQVAHLVGRCPGAVRVAVHRALRSLADGLAASPDGVVPGPGVTATLPRALRPR
jgi:RNA polymerase sigma-70 factor (ECF subfamily)